MKFYILLIGFSCFYLNATTINITYLDDAEVGFNSTEPYTATIENPATTLGEARRFVLEKTVRMFSTQFHNPTPIFWAVSFDELGSFGAITIGPTFTEYTQSNSSDVFGILKVGRHYPKLLIDALTDNVDRQFWADDVDASTRFAPIYNDYSFSGADDGHRFATTVLHELVHLIGFASIDCLKGCLPQPVSYNNHYNQFVYVEGGYNTTWNELTLTEKEDVAMVEDTLFFKGSDATLNFAFNNLNSGTSDNGIGLHSGTNADGSWDGQSVDHLSPKIAPAQLMYSAGADVNELGAAAYILCDIGWCRNNGFVADLSLKSTSETSIKPDTISTIEFEIANLSNETVTNIYLDFELPNGVEFIENSSTAGCTVTGNVVFCEVAELFAAQHLNIDVAVTVNEGQFTIDSKLYSQSFIIDPKGENNLSSLQIISEVSAFSTISLEEKYSVTSGDKVSIAPQFDENPDDEFSFSWSIESGYEFTFEQDSTTGILSLTAPEVSLITSTTLSLTVQSKGRAVVKHINLAISPKPATAKVNTNDKSSGGGGINLMSLWTLLLLIVMRKKLL